VTGGRRRSAADAGFTLLETLVATGLMAVVAGAVFSLANPRTAIASALPDAADMQQRARVAVDAIARDLVAAGAGLDAGADAGSLGRFLPAVLPRRTGRSGADAPDVARNDAVTLTWALGPPAQALTASVLGPSATTLAVTTLPGCPIGDPLCGLAAGSDALVFDALGHADTYRVIDVQGGVATVTPHDAAATYLYPAGARIVAAATRVYYLDAVNRQLHQYDGYLGDTPLVDNVVGLTLEYFGDPAPPAAPKPPPGLENCLYDAAGQPRGGLAVLPSADGSPVPLPLAMLRDGPWCGEGSGRFDADLLRVRRVRVTLRVQAAADARRATGVAYATAGTSHRDDQALPDYVVTTEIAPRNLTGGAR